MKKRRQMRNVVEADPPPDNQGQAVIAAIEREFADFPGTAGLAARQLDTGEELRVNAEEKAR